MSTFQGSAIYIYVYPDEGLWKAVVEYINKHFGYGLKKSGDFQIRQFQTMKIQAFLLG